MRKIRKAAAAFAATGLTALTSVGVLAGSGGVAHAAQGQAITSCSLGNSLLTANVAPTCTADTGTIYNPVAINVTVPANFFQLINSLPGIGLILQLLGSPLATKVTYNLVCNVNGVSVTKAESFQADGSTANDTQSVNLQNDVGSPEPNSCQIQNLTATSLVTINSQIFNLIGSQPFSFGVGATGDNGLPGAIDALYPADTPTARSTVCADDTNDGDAGVKTQAFQCESDLADQWIQTAAHQLVHNGDCLTDNGGNVDIEACQASPASTSTQVWVQQNATGKGTLTNGSDSGCLTAPITGTVDGTQLTVAPCVSGNVGQQWTIPAVTPQ